MVVKLVVKHLPALACTFIWLGVLSSGCGNDEYALTRKERGAFKDAAPEIKQLWESGLEVDHPNDYLAAGNNSRALLTNSITSEQLVAVQTTLGGLNIRLNEAAAKGDASAQKALGAAKESSPRR